MAYIKGLVVTDKDTENAQIFCAAISDDDNQNSIAVARTKEQLVEKYPSLKDQDIIVINLKIQKINYGLLCELLKEITSEKTVAELARTYILKLVREWDIADKDGNILPVEKSVVDKLAPVVVDVISETISDVAFKGHSILKFTAGLQNQ